MIKLTIERDILIERLLIASEREMELISVMDGMELDGSELKEIEDEINEIERALNEIENMIKETLSRVLVGGGY